MITNSNKSWLKPDWPAPANVFAATTLRTGGFSRGVYSSLNPALHVGDDADLVQKNRQHIRTLLNLPSEPVWLNQVHGNRVLDVARVQDLESADGGFCTEPGLVCAVLTADCLPVLMCSSDGLGIAAVHAGWRGLLAGVLGNAVRALPGRDLLAWLGPAIGPGAFVVGDEVRQAFMVQDPNYEAAFHQTDNAKWLADIYRLARIALADVGINRVYGGGYCTVTESEHFFSYRREQITGRMATLIWRT